MRQEKEENVKISSLSNYAYDEIKNGTKKYEERMSYLEFC